jgi:hypothetical protein
MGKIAAYVLDRLDEILDEPAEREARFVWALGDVSAKAGRRARVSLSTPSGPPAA